MPVNWEDYEVVDEGQDDRFAQSEYPRRAEEDEWIPAEVPEAARPAPFTPIAPDQFRTAELQRGADDLSRLWMETGGNIPRFQENPNDPLAQARAGVPGEQAFTQAMDMAEALEQKAAREKLLRARKAAGVEDIPATLKLATAAHDAITRFQQTPYQLAAFANKLVEFPALMDALGVPSPSGGESWQGDERAYLEYMAQKNEKMSAASREIYGDEKIGGVLPPWQVAEGTIQALLELPQNMSGGATIKGGQLVVNAARKALQRSATTSGVLGGARTYAESVGSGMDEDDAEIKGLASGVITRLTTLAFGATGAESIFAKEGARGIWNRVKNAMVHGGFEGLEESSDEFQQVLLDMITTNPNLTVKEAVERILLSGTVGTIVGGAMGAVRGGPKEPPTASAGEASRAFKLDLSSVGADGQKQGGQVASDLGEEFHQLQAMEKSGKLDAESAHRLNYLKEMSTSSGLTPDDLSYLEAERKGMNLDLEINTGSNPDDPFTGNVMVANFRTGKVDVNPHEMKLQMEGMNPEERKAYLKSVLSEEQIHLQTKGKTALNFVKNATGVEKFLAGWRYTGKLSGKTPSGQKLSEENLGHEMLRSQIQRMRGITRTELAASVKSGKLTTQILLATEDAIFDIRQTLGTKASKEQLAALDEVEANLKAGLKLARGTGDDEEESPASLNSRQGLSDPEDADSLASRPPGSMTPEKLMGLDSGVASKFFDGIRERGNATQNDAVLAGFRLTPDDTARLKEMSNSLRPAAEQAVAKNDEHGFKAALGKMAWLNGAIEGANRSGPNYDAVLNRLKSPEAIAKEFNLKFDGDIKGRLQFTIQEKGAAEQAQFTVPEGAGPADIAAKLDATKKRFEDEGPASVRRNERISTKLEDFKRQHIGLAKSRAVNQEVVSSVQSNITEMQRMLEELGLVAVDAGDGFLELNPDSSKVKKEDYGTVLDIEHEIDRAFSLLDQMEADDEGPASVRRNDAEIAKKLNHSDALLRRFVTTIADRVQEGKADAFDLSHEVMEIIDSIRDIPTDRGEFKEMRQRYIEPAMKEAITVVQERHDNAENKEDAELWRDTLDTIHNNTLEVLNAINRKLPPAGEQSFPAAIRRGGPSKRGQEIAEQKRRIAEMQAKARGETLPPELATPKAAPAGEKVSPEDRVGTEAAGWMPPSITPTELEAKSKEILNSPINIPKKERPTFKKFATWAANNSNAKPGQIREMWEDVVWKTLVNASPQRLESLRKVMGLESKYGTKAIPPSPHDPEFALETQHEDKSAAKRENLGGSARQRYRNKVVGAIALKLISESFDGRANLGRDSITIDDIDFSNEKSKAGAYREISASELADESALLAILRDQARASNADPEAASRRVLAVVGPDKRLHLVSTYNDAGVQRVTDPAGGSGKHRPTRVLSQGFLRQYRPIAAILLEDPVRNLRQTFETVSEFMDKIGKEASDRDRISEWEVAPESTTDEDHEIEGTEGIEGEGGSFMGPGKSGVVEQSGGRALQSGKQITEPEVDAIVTTIRNEFESGEPSSTDEVVKALQALFDRTKSGAGSNRDRLALSGIRKAFAKLDLESPDRTVAENIQAIAEDIFYAHGSSDNRGQLVDSLLSSYRDPAKDDPIISGKRPVDYSRDITSLRSVAPTTVRGAPRGTGIPSSRPADPREAQMLSPQDEQGRIRPTEPYTPRGEQRASEKLDKSKQEYLRERERKIAKAKEIRERYRRKRGALMPLSQAARLAGIETGPASIRRNIAKLKLGKKMTEIIRDTGSSYDEWMVQRLERSGGAVAEAVAPVFRKIIDREKELYGSLTPVLDRARAMAGGTSQVPIIGQLPSPSALKATTWMHGLTPVKGVKLAAVSNTVGAIEDTILVPPYAQKLTDAAKLANLEIGIMLQPVIRGFKATGKFARNITATGYDAIREGRGDMWRKWTDAIAAANGKKVSEVRQFFREFKAIIDKPGVDAGMIDKVNQDFTRRFSKAVTHIHHNGAWQPMVHSDLFNYLENAARRATHIRAFREQFPSNPAGQAALAQVQTNLRAEMGDVGQDSIDALMRTMQGIPTDNYSSWGFMGPTRAGGQAFRMANQTIGNLMARALLTGQLIVQPGETIAGGTPLFLGFRNYLRGMAKLKGVYSQMEQQGSVNRVMYDFSFDPRSPVRSLFRIGGNMLSKGFAEQALNELQEGLAASTAKVVADRIKSKELDAWEKRMLPETFKAMGFNANEVLGLMQGDPDLLGQFERKASAFLTSGNRSISEGSKLGANRFFNSIFRFQSYPMMKANQFRRVMVSAAEAWESGTPREKRTATEQMARFIAGTTAQGALTTGIAALLYSGALGLKIKLEEAEEEPLQFLQEVFMATIGGPLYLAWRGMKNKGLLGVGEAATWMVFPYTIATELINFSQGAGRYRDKDAFDKIGAFLDAKVPGTRAIGAGLAMAGLSQEDRKLDAAIDGFYRWRRDVPGFREMRTYLDEDSRTGFRSAMKRAVEALKDGNHDKFLNSYAEAAELLAEEGSKEKPGESLKRAMLLRDVNGKKLDADMHDALRARIGDEAVDRLEYFDLMLERAAEGDLLPRYDD